MFVPPQELVVFESQYWRVNHRIDAKLPGYLMMAPKDLAAVSFSSIERGALTEMGSVLAKVTRVIESYLRPQHLYVGRYGHMGGHNLHLHLIPVYDWVAEAFRNDSRYRTLQQFYTAGVRNSGMETGFDGAEMTLYIWREFVENKTSPPVYGQGIHEVIALLRRALNEPM